MCTAILVVLAAACSGAAAPTWECGVDYAGTGDMTTDIVGRWKLEGQIPIGDEIVDSVMWYEFGADERVRTIHDDGTDVREERWSYSVGSDAVAIYLGDAVGLGLQRLNFVHGEEGWAVDLEATLTRCAD